MTDERLQEAKAVVLAKYPTAEATSDYHQGLEDTSYGEVIVKLGEGIGQAKSLAIRDALAEESAWINAAERIRADKGERMSDNICTRPPQGWECTLKHGHAGPCAARQSRLVPSRYQLEYNKLSFRPAFPSDMGWASDQYNALANLAMHLLNELGLAEAETAQKDAKIALLRAAVAVLTGERDHYKEVERVVLDGSKLSAARSARQVAILRAALIAEGDYQEDSPELQVAIDEAERKLVASCALPVLPGSSWP